MPSGVIGGDASQVFGNIWSKIKAIYSAITSFLSDYFSAASRIDAALSEFLTECHALANNIQSVVQEIHDFKFDPKWKSRVINVPAAIEKTRAFITEVPAEIQKSFQTLRTDLQALVSASEQITQQIGSEGGGSVSGLTKVVSWVSTIQQIFQRLLEFVKSLDVIVQDLKKIITEFETLDTIFLPQGNPRIRVKGTISARDGAINAKR